MEQNDRGVQGRFVTRASTLKGMIMEYNIALAILLRTLFRVIACDGSLGCEYGPRGSVATGKKVCHVGTEGSFISSDDALTIR